MGQHTHWRWRLYEVYVKINGEMHYLWRAVDPEGEVLESFVTKTRDKAAALKFIKKALKRHGSLKAITTDGLRSYKAAMGTGDVEVSSDEELAEIQLRTCLPTQPPQSERHLTRREIYKANRSAALAEWRALMD